ncbi:hypothetical protein ZWY2020_052382, partial [Hordeum vulgare]
MFAQHTGTNGIVGSHTPGTFTNQMQTSFSEPIWLLGKLSDIVLVMIEDHASEVSNSEGSVTMGMSEFTALALNDILSKLQWTYWSNVCYDTCVEVSEKQWDKELQELEYYLQENTCGTISEGLDKILAVECSTLAAKYANISAAERADMTARTIAPSLVPNGSGWSNEAALGVPIRRYGSTLALFASIHFILLT